jgi:hypothetical protein
MIAQIKIEHQPSTEIPPSAVKPLEILGICASGEVSCDWQEDRRMPGYQIDQRIPLAKGGAAHQNHRLMITFCSV